MVDAARSYPSEGERLLRRPEFETSDPADYERRDDGAIVRLDRWRDGIQRIQSALGGSGAYEIPDLVAEVARLAKQVPPKRCCARASGYCPHPACPRGRDEEALCPLPVEDVQPSVAERMAQAARAAAAGVIEDRARGWTFEERDRAEKAALRAVETHVSWMRDVLMQRKRQLQELGRTAEAAEIEVLCEMLLPPAEDGAQEA